MSGTSVGKHGPAVALVLAGAVAKGAFEAGALQVLAEAGVRVVRLVAASSGALNAVAFAAGVRACRERVAAAELVELWRDQATWRDILHLDWRDPVEREGLSDLSRVREILRRAVRPAPERATALAPVSLRLVLAPLDGVDGVIDGQPATTYEKVLDFTGRDFDEASRLEGVFTAALASASFPFVFAPTEVPGLGRCIDGGAVNNTPIHYAIGAAGDPQVDAVVVLSPTVEHVRTPPGELRGTEYIGHLVDMLINERLYRDLREVERRNRALRALAALPSKRCGPDAIATLQSALGWEAARTVDVVQIRPLVPLPGTSFSAFHDADQRADYIASGAARARHVLGAIGWLPQRRSPTGKA